MTHTLHRRGSEKELQKDFVILAMAARGVNREGAAPKLARALEIFAAHHPVNYGNVAGNSLTKPLAELVALTRDNTVSHAVFRSAFSEKRRNCRQNRFLRSLPCAATT